jgi:hypothetical protein
VSSGEDGVAPGVPVIPPDGFVTRFNLAAMAEGQRFRSALDPLVMMAWHLAAERDREPHVPFVTGCL